MTSPISALLTSTQMGQLPLSNRIVMAPLTRNRATQQGIPTALMADYYEQRASAGLIISEGSQISPMGQGYLATPGIYSSAQVTAWRTITERVHAQGGHIVLQLWHVGRISHTSLLPDGQAPVAPSALQAKAKTYIQSGFANVSAPRALSQDEIPALIEDYRHAASNARAAGFDGVEIHAANGYLLNQFLCDQSNQRRDDYGGSIENRSRLLLEVTRVVADTVGAGRTGVRLSPTSTVNDIGDSDPQALYDSVVGALNQIHGLAYLHVIEGITGGPRQPIPFDYQQLRKRFHGAWIVNNGYQGDLGQAAIASGQADAVAFGRLFIANPDLVKRLRDGAPLNPLDSATLYGGGAQGYTDYPFLKT